MVLKTGPDRPVQPRTGVQSSPVRWKNRKIRKMGQKPETAGSTIKTANRSGWTGFGPVPLITKLHRFGLTPVTLLPHASDSLSLVPSPHWTRAVSSLVPSPNRNQRSPHWTRGFSHSRLSTAAACRSLAVCRPLHCHWLGFLHHRFHSFFLCLIESLGKFVLDLVCVWCCECLCEMSIFLSSSYSIF